MTNHILLWNIELAWYSLSATHQICRYGLKCSLKIHGFRPVCTYLIVNFSFYNCAFTFCTINISGCFWIRLCCMFICVAFKFHTEWRDTHQHTNYHNTTRYSRYPHGLNCFGHMMYAQQTSIYQNIACLIDWDFRIHWLLLCKGVRFPTLQWVSWYMTLNNLMVRFQ